jgi:hypothetical protein
VALSRKAIILARFGHIGFSGVGVQKNRKQLVLFEQRDFFRPKLAAPGDKGRQRL